MRVMYVPLGTYSLPKHQLVFHKHGRDDSAKCDVHHTGDIAHTVIGRLFEIDEIEKSHLDRAEGFGAGYNEKFIHVFDTKGRAVRAITYWATAINKRLKPFTWYKQHVLVGALETNLPKEYVNSIKAVPAIEDHDNERGIQELSIHYEYQ